MPNVQNNNSNKYVYEYLKSLGVDDISDNDINKIVESAEKNEDGSISKEAFLKAVEEIHPEIQIDAGSKESIEGWTKLAGKDEILDLGEIEELVGKNNQVQELSGNGNGKVPNHSSSNHSSTYIPQTQTSSAATTKSYEGMSLEALESEKTAEQANLSEAQANIAAVNSGTDPEVKAAKGEVETAQKEYETAVENDPALKEIKTQITENLSLINNLENEIADKGNLLNEYVSNQLAAMDEAYKASANATSLRNAANSVVFPNENDYKNEDGTINKAAYDKAYNEAKKQKENLEKQASEQENIAQNALSDAGVYDFKASKLKEEITALENSLTEAKNTKTELDNQVQSLASEATKQALEKLNSAKDNLELIINTKLEIYTQQFSTAQTNLTNINAQIGMIQAQEQANLQTSETGRIENKNSYINTYQTQVEDTGDTHSTIAAFNEKLEQRNKEEAQNTKIHGMSDEEYQEYRAYMKNTYGLDLEQPFNYGNFKNVAQSMATSCSNSVRFRSASRCAASYDSVLDLVLDEKLNIAMKEIFGENATPNWERLANCKKLEEYGIKAVKIRDREYSFALVDENGNIIKDENNDLAQVYKNDYLMPDGAAQRNEIRNAEALDQMGFNCYSLLDISKEEYELIQKMAHMKNSELGTSSGIKATDVNAIRLAVLGEDDSYIQDNSDWLNGTYVDKVTGETVGAKSRKYFNDARYYHYDGTNSSTSNMKNILEDISSDTPIPLGKGIIGDITKYTLAQLEAMDEPKEKEKVTLSEYKQMITGVMEKNSCTEAEATRMVNKFYKK